MCIRHTVASAAENDLGHARIVAKRADVIDHRRSKRERTLGHLGLGGVDRDRRAGQREAIRSIAGTTRRSSSSVETGRAPGRADSPPMSTIAAPSCTRRAACAAERPRVGERTAVENESGVTLTIPITSGSMRCPPEAPVDRSMTGARRPSEPDPRPVSRPRRSALRAERPQRADCGIAPQNRARTRSRTRPESRSRRTDIRCRPSAGRASSGSAQDLERAGLSRVQRPQQVREGEAGVDDVLDDEHVAPFDRPRSGPS